MKDRLEKIVASLELCRLIPDGEFEDTALVWEEAHWCDFKPEGESNERCEYSVNTRIQGEKNAKCSSAGVKIISAPTLAEILEELPEDEFDTVGNPESWLSMDRVPEAGSKEWAVGHNKYPESYRMEDENPANAALRLWLKLKGI